MQETMRHLQEISVSWRYLQEMSDGDIDLYETKRYLEENMRNLQDTMGYFLFVVPCLALLQNINIIVHAAYFKTSLKQ